MSENGENCSSQFLPEPHVTYLNVLFLVTNSLKPKEFLTFETTFNQLFKTLCEQTLQ